MTGAPSRRRLHSGNRHQQEEVAGADAHGGEHKLGTVHQQPQNHAGIIDSSEFRRFLIAIRH